MKRKKGDEVEVSEINLLFTSPTLFLNSKPIPNHQQPLTTTTGPPVGTSDAALHAGAVGGRDGAEEGVEVGGCRRCRPGRQPLRTTTTYPAPRTRRPRLRDTRVTDSRVNPIYPRDKASLEALACLEPYLARYQAPLGSSEQGKAFRRTAKPVSQRCETRSQGTPAWQGRPHMNAGRLSLAGHRVTCC